MVVVYYAIVVLLLQRALGFRLMSLYQVVFCTQVVLCGCHPSVLFCGGTKY